MRLFTLILLFLLMLQGCQSGGDSGSSSSSESSHSSLTSSESSAQSSSLYTSSSSVNSSLTSSAASYSSSPVVASSVSSAASSSSTPLASSSSISSAVSSISSSASSSSSSYAPLSDYGCDFPSALVAAELRPLIVIRVNYNDITFQSNAATWSAKIFGTNNHQLNHYYETISKGRFGFAKAVETDGAADGVITVALDKNHPDYDINNNDDFLNNFQPDISAALSETDAFINYSQYDKNHNGVITPDELIVMFILAGNEDAFSGNNASAGVWAHQSCVSPANAPTLDGVSLMGCLGGGNYAVFGERHVDQSINYNHDATIGIIAHELGHAAFTLPDLYDTSGASAGIGYFGLMGSGLWGRASAADLYGNTPVQMTAWSKLHNGWIVPEVVLDTPYADLTFYDTASADYNIALFPIGEAQCFLVENRSTSGYDAGLNDINSYYKGGLAIWHIDQDVINADTLTNTVNADAAHKGVDLEEAAYAGLDGSATFPGDAHNLFWLGNKTAFTSATNPSSKQYDGGDSGVAVTGIDEANPVMHAVAANPNKVVTP